VKISCN